MKVVTSDAKGKPVPATVTISIVDDANLQVMARLCAWRTVV